MSKYLGILFYFGALLTAMQGWFVMTICFAFLFTLQHNAAWLFLIAILLDGYFGAFFSFPTLTVASILWFLVAEFIKPTVLWHNTNNGS